MPYDHNGECLHCDEPFPFHAGNCPEAPAPPRAGRPRRLPRKTKKAIDNWLGDPAYRLRGRNRRRFLCWLQRQRSADWRMAPVRHWNGAPRWGLLQRVSDWPMPR